MMTKGPDEVLQDFCRENKPRPTLYLHDRPSRGPKVTGANGASHDSTDAL